MEKAEQKINPSVFPHPWWSVYTFIWAMNRQSPPKKKKKNPEDVLFFKVLQYNKYMICTKDTTGPV